MHNLERYTQMLIPVLNRYAIKQAAIFGSLAKGTMTEHSNIDLLIEPGLGFTLFTMLQLEEDISRLTNHKTDIVEYKALKPSIKNEVMLTAIPIL